MQLVFAMEVHDSVDRCNGCVGTRERCSDCRWKCKCSKQFNNKNSFRNHLRNSEIKPKNKTAEKLLSTEHIFSFLSQPCCSLNCISYWSIHEIKSYLRKMVNLNIKEKSTKISDLLKLMLTKEDDKGSHTINDITGRRFNIDIDEFEYHTSWVGYPKKTWEAKSCFVEEDGSTTDILLEYEQKHPNRKIKVKLESQQSSQNNDNSNNNNNNNSSNNNKRSKKI